MTLDLNRRHFLAGAVGVALGSLAAPAAAAGAFGWTSDSVSYVVNTGADLVFKVNRANGDLTSLVYKGVEYQGYGGRNSHLESGLGASTVTLSQPATGVILITVVHGTLTHYYAARSGENNIYLFTRKADSSVTVTRFLARLKPGIFPITDPDTWDATTDTVIEAGDVYRRPDGTTRSKHYSGLRVMDYDYTGFSNGSAGVWIVRSNHEKASGGPFYRSLLRHGNEGGAGVYEILHYNQAQTEPERYGLQGPYVLALTDGGAPASSLYARNIDTRWVDALGLTGWVGAAGRGRVAGVGLTGRNSAYPYTVGLANPAAQYWTSANASTGYFSLPGVLPGTYTLSVYKGELAVHTRQVTVTAGGTTTLNTISIGGDPSTAAALWRIGDWDGTPKGFKNAELLNRAHPSDVRAAAWSASYLVGSSGVADWPGHQFREINNGLQISFRLTAAQAVQRRLRIGITTALSGARPQITVNGWTSAVPAPATQPSTRSQTTGSYRGNNHTYEYVIPASAWLSDPAAYNTLRIHVASGSSGAGYLSPSYAFDAIDLL